MAEADSSGLEELFDLRLDSKQPSDPQTGHSSGRTLVKTSASTDGPAMSRTGSPHRKGRPRSTSRRMGLSSAAPQSRIRRRQQQRDRSPSPGESRRNHRVESKRSNSRHRGLKEQISQMGGVQPTASQELQQDLTNASDEMEATPADGDAISSVGVGMSSVPTFRSMDFKSVKPISRIDLIVPLAGEENEWLCGRLDCGSDYNLISEQAARRLTNIAKLRKTSVDVKVQAISDKVLRLHKRMKLKFLIRRTSLRCKTSFLVVPDIYCNGIFDVLIGEPTIVWFGLLELGSELRKAHTAKSS